MTSGNLDFVASLAVLCEHALSEESAILADRVPDLHIAACWAEFAQACAYRALYVCEGRS